MKYRPSEVKARHLARKAVVYVRQSSDAQVRDNRGSADYQRDQQRHARAWGWTTDQIEVIDDDLGLSGTTAAHRHGYQRLLQSIAEDHVGIVLVSDASRLGREPTEIFRFVHACLLKQVLLAVDGRITDLTESGALFLTKLTALLNEQDNLRRREHIRRGIEASLAAGRAVSRPPVGYVRTDKGQWAFDPNLDVQRVLALVFRTFLEERSCPRVVRALRGMGIKLPRKLWGRPLDWVQPKVNAILTILKNPNYTDRYVYRRRICDPARGYNPSGRLRIRSSTADEIVVVDHHHPPYVARADWEAIQDMLRSNAVRPTHQSMGSGAALLQGLLCCPVHPNRVMTVHYKPPRRDGHRRHAYTCLGSYADGGPKCSSVSGLTLDAAVAKAVLQRLAPPTLTALHEAWQRAQHRTLDAERAAAARTERVRRNVHDLEHRFLLVNPTHRLVAESLEAQLEAAKRELLACETAGAARPRTTLAAEEVTELATLSPSVSELFYAPTTRHSDRKELVRALVKHVTLVERSAESCRLGITWVDAADWTLLNVPTPEHARREIVRLSRRDLTPQAICDQLAAQGLVTKLGTRWTPDAVRDVIRTRRKPVRDRPAA